MYSIIGESVLFDNPASLYEVTDMYIHTYVRTHIIIVLYVFGKTVYAFQHSNASFLYCHLHSSALARQLFGKNNS